MNLQTFRCGSKVAWYVGNSHIFSIFWINVSDGAHSTMSQIFIYSYMTDIKAWMVHIRSTCIFPDFLLCILLGKLLLFSRFMFSYYRKLVFFYKSCKVDASFRQFIYQRFCYMVFLHVALLKCAWLNLMGHFWRTV